MAPYVMSAAVAGPTQPLPNFCFDVGIARSRREGVTCSLTSQSFIEILGHRPRRFQKFWALLCPSFANVAENEMLTLAAPSGHRALRPHLRCEEGSGKGRPPCGERHVSDAPLCGRVSWKKLRKSQAALRIQNTCLLRRGPHFRKLSRAVLRVYLSQVLTLLLS